VEKKMGVLKFIPEFVPKALPTAAVVALMVVAAAGCQTASKVTNGRLIEHQALIDFSGLAPVDTIEAVKVSCSVPRQWEPMPLKKTPLYAHQQWRSPSSHTGVGVVFVHLPLPLSERMLLWFAKREYTKSNEDGKSLGQWTDELGREWFEAENNKYHVRGYALVRGFNAWLVYFGTKTGYPPDMAELGLAARCVETFIPDPRRPTRVPELNSDDGATIASGKVGAE
jgi:hypothetical protein